MYLICIDTQCPHRRLITSWNEQFTHSQCRPQIQQEQFLITLNEGINRNNINQIHSLKSQIAVKFQEFEMDIIEEIKNSLRSLQEYYNLINSQFLDNIQEILHEIHNFNPIDFLTIENKLKNPDFLRFCVNVLDNKINYPDYFYLDDSFNSLNKEFEKLYLQIQKVFNHPGKVYQHDFQPSQKKVTQVNIEDPLINIPLKGYKRLEESQNLSQIDAVQNKTIVINQKSQSESSIQEMKSNQQIQKNKNAASQKQNTEIQLTNQQIAYVPYEFKFTESESQLKEKPNIKAKKQEEAKKQKVAPVVPLPAFEVATCINKFSNEQKPDTIQISKTKISALSHKNGTIYLEGFLNKALSYQINFQLKFLTEEINYDNYFEFGLIDCSTFKPPKQFKCLQQGVYSINHLGQISKNCLQTDSKLKMSHNCFLIMKFEGSTSNLTFQLNQLTTSINVDNIKGQICFFTTIQKGQLIIQN